MHIIEYWKMLDCKEIFYRGVSYVDLNDQWLISTNPIFKDPEDVEDENPYRIYQKLETFRGLYGELLQNNPRVRISDDNRYYLLKSGDNKISIADEPEGITLTYFLEPGWTFNINRRPRSLGDFTYKMESCLGLILDKINS